MISRHYPQASGADQPYLALLESVVLRQAELIAQWMLVGFIHGVMNTDNMSVAGETIDYGPCAFLDEYDPGKVFSSIDYQGRYAYANQPQIANWNLARLAETLLPVIDDDQQKATARAEESLGHFSGRFKEEYSAGLRKKLGLATSRGGDNELAVGFLSLLAANEVDFTLAFRRLSDAVDPESEAPLRAMFQDSLGFDSWAERWRKRIKGEGVSAPKRLASMRAVNPAFIPRNHRIEAMIQSAVERDEYAPFEELLTVLAAPFEDQPKFAQYMDPPKPAERVCQTFCGT